MLSSDDADGEAALAVAASSSKGGSLGCEDADQVEGKRSGPPAAPSSSSSSSKGTAAASGSGSLSADDFDIELLAAKQARPDDGTLISMPRAGSTAKKKQEPASEGDLIIHCAAPFAAKKSQAGRICCCPCAPHRALPPQDRYEPIRIPFLPTLTVSDLRSRVAEESQFHLAADSQKLYAIKLRKELVDVDPNSTERHPQPQLVSAYGLKPGDEIRASKFQSIAPRLTRAELLPWPAVWGTLLMVLISIPVHFYLRYLVAPDIVETGWSRLTIPVQFNATGYQLKKLLLDSSLDYIVEAIVIVLVLVIMIVSAVLACTLGRCVSCKLPPCCVSSAMTDLLQRGFPLRALRITQTIAILVLCVTTAFVLVMYNGGLLLQKDLHAFFFNIIGGGKNTLFNLQALLECLKFLLWWASNTAAMAPLVSQLPDVPIPMIGSLIETAKVYAALGHDLAMIFITCREILMKTLMSLMLITIVFSLVGIAKKSKTMLKVAMFALLLASLALCLLHALLNAPVYAILNASCVQMNKIAEEGANSSVVESSPDITRVFSFCDGTGPMATTMEFAAAYLNTGVGQLNGLLALGGTGMSINNTINLDKAFSNAGAPALPGHAPPAMPGDAPAMHRRRLLGLSMPDSASGAANQEQSYSTAQANAAAQSTPPPTDIALDDLSAQSADIGCQAGSLSEAIKLGTLPNVGQILARQLQEIKSFLEALQVMATTLTTVFSLAKCDIMERMTEQARVDVCQHVLQDLEFIVQWEKWALGLMLISFFINCLFLLLLYLPRKRWVCLEDRAHFRFKASLLAHRAVSVTEDVVRFHVPVSWADLSGSGGPLSDRYLCNELKHALRSDLYDIVSRLGLAFGYPEYSLPQSTGDELGVHSTTAGLKRGHIRLTFHQGSGLHTPTRVDLQLRVPVQDTLVQNTIHLLEVLQSAEDAACQEWTHTRAFFTKYKFPSSPSDIWLDMATNPMPPASAAAANAVPSGGMDVDTIAAQLVSTEKWPPVVIWPPADCCMKCRCSCCSCLDCCTEKEGQLRFVGVFRRRVLKEATTGVVVVGDQPAGLFDDDDIQDAGSGPTTIRLGLRAVTIDSDLKTDGGIFVEKPMFKFGEQLNSLSNVQLKFAHFLKHGEVQLFNRSLRRGMTRDAREAISRTVQHFSRRLMSGGERAGYVGLSTVDTTVVKMQFLTAKEVPEEIDFDSLPALNLDVMDAPLAHRHDGSFRMADDTNEACQDCMQCFKLLSPPVEDTSAQLNATQTIVTVLQKDGNVAYSADAVRSAFAQFSGGAFKTHDVQQKNLTDGELIRALVTITPGGAINFEGVNFFPIRWIRHRPAHGKTVTGLHVVGVHDEAIRGHVELSNGAILENPTFPCGAVHRNNSGELSKSLFLRTVMKNTQLTAEQAEALFADWDLDGSGTITLEEILRSCPPIEDIIATKAAGISVTGFASVVAHASTPMNMVGGNETIAVYEVRVGSMCGCRKRSARNCSLWFEEVSITLRATRDNIAVLFCGVLLMLVPQGIMALSNDPFLAIGLICVGLLGFYGTKDRYHDPDRKMSVAFAMIGVACLLAYLSLQAWEVTDVLYNSCKVQSMLYSSTDVLNAETEVEASLCTPTYITSQSAWLYFAGTLIVHLLLTVFLGGVFMAVFHHLMSEERRVILDKLAGAGDQDRDIRLRPKQLQKRVGSIMRSLVKHTAKTRASRRSASMRDECRFCCLSLRERNWIVPKIKQFFALAFLTISLISSCILIDRSEAVGYGTRPVCNGAYATCDTPIDKFMFVTSHNAMAHVPFIGSNPNHSFVIPSQFNSVESQLVLGARALSFDGIESYSDSDITLCDKNHGCDYGSESLDVSLQAVSDFLDTDTVFRANISKSSGGIVIALLLKGTVSSTALANAFTRTGLISKLFNTSNLDQENASAPWPSFGSLLCCNHQLLFETRALQPCEPTPVVVFVENLIGEPLPWVHDSSKEVWSTNSDNKRLDDLSCDYSSGSRTGRFMKANHYLRNPGASPALADAANHNPFLFTHLYNCSNKTGVVPNFLNVDFVEYGDAFEVARTMNGQPVDIAGSTEKYRLLSLDVARLFAFPANFIEFTVAQLSLVGCFVLVSIILIVACFRCCRCGRLCLQRDGDELQEPAFTAPPPKQQLAKAAPNEALLAGRKSTEVIV